MKSLTDVLGDVLAIRGVLAVAVVSSDGDVLAVNAADTALLERMIGTVTGALAAGVALATLVETGAAPGDGEVSAGHGAAEIGDGTGSAWPAFDAPGAATASADPVSEAQHVPSAELSDGDAAGAGRQLMVIYQDTGPIVFTPLPGGERVVVVALRAAQDLGRARFQLRSLTLALSTAEVPLG